MESKVKPLGHPVHAMLTDVPAALFTPISLSARTTPAPEPVQDRPARRDRPARIT